MMRPPFRIRRHRADRPASLVFLARLAIPASLGLAMAVLSAAAGGALALSPVAAAAQEARVKDLVTVERDVPRRLMGYGIMVGLDGTGDRAMGTVGSPQTVRSVANLLRRFGVEVPAEVLRTRNVAAVLVTAEVSPYLHAGGHFDVSVASLGDALSLRGGVLWSTPLMAGPGDPPVATAQGAVVLSQGAAVRNQYHVETSGAIPSGGLLQVESGVPSFAGPTRLLLRSPDIATAVRVAAVVNQDAGSELATVEDPGSVLLQPPRDQPLATFLGRVGELRVAPDRAARVIIDARDGTVVAGAGITLGPAVVSHGTLTLAIGSADTTDSPGSVRVPPGTSVQDVAIALHAVAATPAAIAAIFRSLQAVGSLTADVEVR